MAGTLVNHAGEQFVRTHLQHIPRPDRLACQAIREWARQQGHDLDPDKTDVVTLHYRGDKAVITQRLSLTQAVLANWQGETDKNLIGQLFPGHWAGTSPNGPLTIVERLPAPGVLDNGGHYAVFNGLFRRTSPVRYDSTTHLSVDVEAMQRFIWNLDFHSQFIAMLDTYWQQAAGSHGQSLQISFIAACNKQVEEGSLSDIGRQLAWQAAGLMAKAPGLQVRPLNVYGYAATDLIYIADPAKPQVVLYLPGNASPLHAFDNMAAMQDWFAEQCRSDDKRLSLRQYFKLADTPDGLDFSGLDTALDGLGAYPGMHHRSPNRPGFTVDGHWPPGEYVNYKADKYSPQLEGDLFAALTQRQRERSYADADFIITSDAQVTKARWRGYLVTTLNLLAPLALVVPELIPLLAVGGIAQFGLGLDQAINGKSLADKDAGVGDIAFGLLNAAPFAMLPAARPRMLFPGKSSRFIVPTRLNDQWGYPMSPNSPPRLPEEAVADFFVPAEPPVAAARIARGPLNHATGTNALLALRDGNEVEVLYYIQHDVFILKEDANEVLPNYYQVTAGTRDLYEVNPVTRGASDAMRMYTLRNLDVELQLPLSVPLVDSAHVTPLPKQILSIWVGNKSIPDELVENIASNAKRLEGTGFTYDFYLSKANPKAFMKNRAKLTAASNLQVKTLEEQPFYTAFEQSEFYHQYRQALDSDGANFASASDILRYPLLDAQGGIYMDVDDTLRSFEDNPDSFAMISSVAVKTTPDGLVLGSPVNNELLGMHCDYNSNIIGSHANNPTLRAISAEMNARLRSNPSFYDTRPLAGTHGYEAYAQELSRMTGPGLLNDMVARHLPRLQFLRQLSKLESIPETGYRSLMADLALPVAQARNIDQALGSVATIGNYHSWGRP
ncbi:dermonecrotic toxin domain-containing protein [Pseudomonas sp. NPDC089407]|uniref:dermonecrotic toxin domain-containing protein n=1 Tax=Pseudomonas sp. NPDC089407 TaxID=3364464 RepID=UPI00384DD519